MRIWTNNHVITLDEACDFTLLYSSDSSESDKVFLSLMGDKKSLFNRKPLFPAALLGVDMYTWRKPGNSKTDFGRDADRKHTRFTTGIQGKWAIENSYDGFGSSFDKVSTAAVNNLVIREAK